MRKQPSPWTDPEFARTYAEESANPASGWYEQAVSAPSVVALVPKDAKRILDFGCGPGDFTAVLHAQMPEVEGCDYSPAMIEIATEQHPKITFFQWDGQTSLPPGHGPYDAITSKLVVPFIQDLGSHIKQLKQALQPVGSVIISAVHPVHSAKQVANYWKTAEYRQQIGRFGIYDTPLHRSLEGIVGEFLGQGFVLTGLAEPEVPEHLAKAHLSRPDEFSLPKRINLRFRCDPNLEV